MKPVQLSTSLSQRTRAGLGSTLLTSGRSLDPFLRCQLLQPGQDEAARGLSLDGIGADVVVSQGLVAEALALALALPKRESSPHLVALVGSRDHGPALLGS